MQKLSPCYITFNAVLKEIPSCIIDTYNASLRRLFLFFWWSWQCVARDRRHRVPRKTGFKPKKLSSKRLVEQRGPCTKEKRKNLKCPSWKRQTLKSQKRKENFKTFKGRGQVDTEGSVSEHKAQNKVHARRLKLDFDTV